MAKFNISLPSGFPEFTPAQERIRHQWIQTIQNIFESNGFLSIQTPLVERQENFLAKGGNAKEIYVLKRLHDEEGDSSHSGNALRFDHTVPLALYVARHLNDIKFPFKRSVIGPVLRGERAQKGRFRQFDQCDIDIIGSENLSLLNDALMPAIIIQIFEKLNIGDFVVRINNRKILTSFFSSLSVPADQIKNCFDALDELEKKGEKFVSLKLKKQGMTENSIQKVFEFFQISGSTDSIFQQLESLNLNGVAELKTVIQGLKDMGIPEDRYRIDLSIARGLDYYTGTVYETTLTKYPTLGSICSGGRYDDLAEIFTGKRLPGVGISIGLTRLLFQLFDAGIIKPNRMSPSDVLIITPDTQHQKEALALGFDLRKKGIKCENYLEDKKINKQFDYANKLGIPFCLVLGEDEIKNGEVMLKNMTTGEQQTIDRLNTQEIKSIINS